MSTTTTKTCWPELVGKTADEAVQVIKDESGLSKVHVCGPGSRTTRDIDDERVRVYVDEDNKVTTQPTVGDKAWLVSEVIKSPKGACLDFWYQAFVSSYITFNVYMQNGTSVAVHIYCRSGTTARDQWTYVSVNLETIRSSTYLIISAVVVSLTIVYVAIDDLKILNGICPSPRVCDFEEQSICDYQNDATADFT